MKKMENRTENGPLSSKTDGLDGGGIKKKESAMVHLLCGTQREEKK